MSKHSLLGLITSLERATHNLEWNPQQTEWGDYYECTNYTSEALNHKKELVDHFITKTNAKAVWDFGANTGLFSNISSGKGLPTIAFDIDPVAVERNYIKAKEGNDKLMLPLLLDLTNPSPPIGWMNTERSSIIDRGPVDLAMALALSHHLAISHNLPFRKIAEFFHTVCRWLVIEFIPKNDSQIQRLLATREDIFIGYSQKAFEIEFKRMFEIIASERIRGTQRTLYFMRCV